MTRQQELEHWTKCERYFAKATPEQIMNCAKWYLFIEDHYIPCRCADEPHRLLEGIEHTEMFGILRNRETIKMKTQNAKP